MFNKRVNLTHKNFLLSLYIVILGVLVPAAYWIINNDKLPSLAKKEQYTIQQRISSGDKILITAHGNAAKQSGVEAYAKGNYVKALQEFNSALKKNRNDPEALIYLNNALAAKTKEPDEVGVSVPIGGNLNVAQEILRGVAQAQHEINHNGGHQR